MSEGLPAYWVTLHEASKARLLESGGKVEESALQAGRLVAEHRDRGHVRVPCRKALGTDLYAWVLFYEELAKEAALPGHVPSPVEGEHDSRWMAQRDYCFVNARATSLSPDRTGTFLEAMKLLPGLRVTGIHLAPFFDCVMDNLYAVDSHRILTPAVLDHDLAARGLEGDDQLRCFLDAAHLLGMVVGFDLEPHTSQFSRIVLENPGHFRWLRLNEKRTGLFGGVVQADMLTREAQKKLTDEVRQIVREHLRANGLSSVEDPAAAPDEIRRVHGDLIRDLIKRGYWTLPSHTWGGAGLPAFKAYNKKDDYPTFTYLSTKGEDHDEHAFGMLTPFKFFDGLPINTVPDEKSLPKPDTEVLEFFSRIFPRIQERFAFDFVRVDYVDHVFDSAVEGHADLPVSDRPIATVLERAIAQAREGHPYTGAMAERMGMDIEEYAGVGFDLILGLDILSTIHTRTLAGLFRFGYDLEEFNAEREVPASVLFAVDTHDSGHPLFWTSPLSQVMGARGLQLRHFVSRFGSAGMGRRPKYECMGNNDLSHGLYHANNKLVSLTWVGDEAHNLAYHCIEDTFEQFRDLIENGRIGEYHLFQRFGWWFINRADGTRERLLCVTNLEKAYRKLAYILHPEREAEDRRKQAEKEAALRAKDPAAAAQVVAEEPADVDDGARPEQILINFRENYGLEDPEILEIDFSTGRPKPFTKKESDWQLRVDTLEPRGFRLFWIFDRTQPPRRYQEETGA